MFRTSLFSATRSFSSSAFRLQNSAFFDEFAVILKTDLKKSMLAKDNAKKETVKMLRSELKNFEIDSKGKENNEFGISKVINKMMKTRKNSIEEYSKLERQDLVEHETAQLKCLQAYLVQLPIASEDEVISKITKLLEDKKSSLKEDEKMPLAAVIAKELDFKTLSEQWKTSEKDIRKNLFMVYKQLKL